MFNLLLVDDERYILDGLRNNIDWALLDIQEVYCVEDADEALQILESHRIDVVITDIRMPGQDGLSLGSGIQQKWPYTKVIILSGYRDFEYAQKAVSINAFSYLVKPVRYDDLEAQVRQALEELQEDLRSRSILEKAEQKLARMTPLLQDRYLRRWLEEDSSHPESNCQELQDYGLDIRRQDRGFWVLISAKGGTTTQVNTYHLALEELSLQMLRKDVRMVSYLSLESRSAFLFLDEDAEKLSSFFHRTLEYLDSYLYSVQTTLNPSASIFWDFPAPLSMLADQYRELSKRMNRRTGRECGSISGPASEETDITKSDLKALHLHPSLLTLIASREKDELLKRIGQLFSELRAQGGYHEPALAIYHAITGAVLIDSLQNSISVDSLEDDLRDFLESWTISGNLQAFETQCKRLVTQYLALVSSNMDAAEGKLITRVRKIVEENLQSVLSVRHIAEQCHYNPTYLSRIFKDSSGISLQEYIIQIRMERAKKLLDQGIKVSDVAIAVGYDSLPIFSRAFKRTVGVSPKQYQSH